MSNAQIESSRAAASEAVQRKEITKAVAVGAIGNVLEWFDFGVYGYFAPFIGKLFFPRSDPLASMFAAFAVLAVGAVSRPLGAVVTPIGELEHGKRTARCGTLSSRVNIVTCNGGIVLKTDTAARVKKHREALRAAGLRPVQIWVPDIRRPGFAKECRRQSRKLRNDPN